VEYLCGRYEVSERHACSVLRSLEHANELWKHSGRFRKSHQRLCVRQRRGSRRKFQGTERRSIYSVKRSVVYCAERRIARGQVIDVTLIYQLESGGKVASTNYAMPGFSFNFNFSTALGDGWFEEKAQFTRANSCPGSETLTVKNTGAMMVDYAAIRTECNTIPEPGSSSLAAWSLGLLLLRQLCLRVGGL